MKLKIKENHTGVMTLNEGITFHKYTKGMSFPINYLQSITFKNFNFFLTDAQRVCIRLVACFKRLI